MTRLTLLIVNYRSAELAAAAIESARRAHPNPIEVVVVDNSCEANEIEALSGAGADLVLASPSNDGYAGGINRGLASCSGDFVIVSNPDVLFSARSIEALLGPLGQPRVTMTGPAFYWDEQQRWHLPPAQSMGLPAQLGRSLATRSPRLRKWLAREALRERIRLWRCDAPVEVSVLSGAVMAMRADDWRRFGMDARYPLYFEEVDLMLRIRRDGGRLMHVPGARVTHLWAQSSARNPRAEALFAASQTVFNRRWFGAPGSALLRAAGRAVDAPEPGPPTGPARVDDLDPGRSLVELGDTADFLMAAGHFPVEKRVELPRDAIARSPLREIHARVVRLEDLQPLRHWIVPTGAG